jgi:hypothetical protein
VSERVRDVSVLVAVTATPGKAAPDSSVTFPRMSPVVVPVACASRTADEAQRIAVKRERLNTVSVPPSGPAALRFDPADPSKRDKNIEPEARW